MIPISPRLLACASMIKGRIVCDIGTDHAYLPAWLIMSNKADRVIATDIHEGPLRAAKDTLRRFGVSDHIELQLSDGFDRVKHEGITDTVIAGMGGETIRDILSSDSALFLKNSVNLVLQPMTKAEVLRRWLSENGFSVTRETAVKDTKIYCVIQAIYTGRSRTITEAESFCGSLNPSELLTRIYISEILSRLQKREEGLKAAGEMEEAQAVRLLIADINRFISSGGNK